MTYYHYLAAAQWSYREKGYHCISVPWLLGETPVARHEDSTKELSTTSLQSLGRIMSQGQLTTGKYQTLVPCMTRERTSDLAMQSMVLSILDYDKEAVWQEHKTSACKERMLGEIRHTLKEITQGQLESSVHVCEGSNEVLIKTPAADQLPPLAYLVQNQAFLGVWTFASVLIEPYFSSTLQQLGLTSPLSFLES